MPLTPNRGLTKTTGVSGWMATIHFTTVRAPVLISGHFASLPGKMRNAPLGSIFYPPFCIFAYCLDYSGNPPIKQWNYLQTLGLQTDRRETPSANDFRRVFTITILRNGTDLVTLARFMGHNRLKVLQRYLKLLQKTFKKPTGGLVPLMMRTIIWGV